MIRPEVGLALAAGIAISPGPAAGQSAPSVTVGARISNEPGEGILQPALAFGQRFRFGTGRWSLDGSASVIGRLDGRWGTEGHLDGSWGPRRGAGFQPGAGLSIAWDDPPGTTGSGELGGTAWIERRWPNASVRVGAAGAKPLGGDIAWAAGAIAAGEVRIGRLTISGNLGRSVARRLRTGGASGQEQPTLPPPTDSLTSFALGGAAPADTLAGDYASPTEAALGIRWRRAGLGLGLTVERRIGLGAERDGVGWSSEARLPIGGRVVLHATAGYRAVGTSRFLPRRSFATLGIELGRHTMGRGREAGRDRPATFNVTRRDGLATIAIRPGPSRSVEAMGDFSNWRPIALRPRGDGVWALVLPLAPGVYLLNVRIDGGAWIVPPGVPERADDFGGRVGVFVVP